MSRFTNITVTDYTNTSVVVEGETIKYKEDLKKLGGKYNAKLKNGPGWIFPKSSEKDIISFINGGKRLVSEEEEQTANEISKQKSKEWKEKQTFKSPIISEQKTDDVLTELKNIMTELMFIKKSLNVIMTDNQKKKVNQPSDEEECDIIVSQKRLLR
jgi:hypothetical protein